MFRVHSLESVPRQDHGNTDLWWLSHQRRPLLPSVPQCQDVSDKRGQVSVSGKYVNCEDNDKTDSNFLHRSPLLLTRLI